MVDLLLIYDEFSLPRSLMQSLAFFSCASSPLRGDNCRGPPLSAGENIAARARRLVQ